MSLIWKFLAGMLAGAAGAIASNALISKDNRARSLNRRIENLNDKAKNSLLICDDIIMKPQEPETYMEDEVVKHDNGEFANYLHKKNLKSVNWDTSKDKIARLSPIISALPTAGISAHLSGQKYMIVEAHGHLSKAKDGFGFRAIIHGSDGKIVDQAKLHASNFGKVLNPALIFNAVSVIVAQKHLNDISDKLDKMSHEIKKISNFQENERLNRLVGSYNYLIDFMKRSEFSPEYIERNCVKIEDIYEKSFSIHGHLIDDLKNIGIDFYNVEQSSRKIDEMGRLVAQIFLCMKIKFACRMLLQIISPNPKNVTDSLNDYHNDITEIPKLLFNNFSTFFIRDIDILDNVSNASIMEEEIDLFLDNFEESFHDFAEYYNDFSRTLYSMSNQNRQILLKMEEKKIVGLSDI